MAFDHKAFLAGFHAGLAIHAAAFVAFAAVLRRGIVKADTDVLIDVKSLWWTHEEQEARGRAVMAEIEREFESQNELEQYRGPLQ